MEWNPRYLAYCKAKGHEGDPEGMLKADKEEWPGGCMCGFIFWMNDRWNEFASLTGVPRNSETGSRQDHHDKFDSWLQGRGNQDI
jgi:hypothetical protein